MKLTFDVTTEQAFQIMRILTRNVQYMWDEKTALTANKRDRLSLMGRVRDAIPQFYPLAVNDDMDTILEKVTDLSGDIKRYSNRIEEEQEE